MGVEVGVGVEVDVAVGVGVSVCTGITPVALIALSWPPVEEPSNCRMLKWDGPP